MLRNNLQEWRRTRDPYGKLRGHFITPGAPGQISRPRTLGLPFFIRIQI